MSLVRLLLVVICLTTVHAQTALAERVVLFLGDSLTAGFGVEPEEAYPRLIAELLTTDGITDVRIVNGSISGSTSASAPSRLRWYRTIHPSVLFLALGANDGLRGFAVDTLHQNLTEVIETAQAQGMHVLLAGMELPPNYGDDYTGRFRRVYRDLAARYDLTLIPFLLEGVGGVVSLNQADGIHPNAEGHRQIASRIYPVLKNYLETIPAQHKGNDHDPAEQPPAR